MKSKAYVLHQIRNLLRANRGLCDEEIEAWVLENETKTVYELLTFKKELEQSQVYRDVSCLLWFRGED
jgi:uncharacterized phage-associated protein